MNYFKYFQLHQTVEGRVVPSSTVTPVRQMVEHKKPHQEIYAPFKRGTLTHPNKDEWMRIPSISICGRRSTT